MTTDTTDTATNRLPLACAIEAIPLGERPSHRDLTTRLFGQRARGRQDIGDGYAFRFDAAAFDEVARFVGNERKCCPFLAFEVELLPEGGPLWLRLSGPPGTQAFLEAELFLRSS